MGKEVFTPRPPLGHIEQHDKVDANKKPPSLPPPLTGFATRDASGVDGVSFLATMAGVSASNNEAGDALLAESATGTAVHAKSGNLAGLFEGNVQVTGNIDLTGATSDITLQNEDCAEQFDIGDQSMVVPGAVMIINEAGLLQLSSVAYDKRVAGVVSGAGPFRPAMTLGVRTTAYRRVPIAMFGKVFCQVDATRLPIIVGDLLTTSDVEGCAMAVDEPARALGTIIGKALAPLASGRGVIPILVSLQ